MFKITVPYKDMRLHYIFLILVILSGCAPESKPLKAEDFIDSEALFNISINGAEQLATNLKNSAFINEFSKTNTHKEISKHFDIVGKLPSKETLFLNLYNSSQFSLATKYNKQVLKALVINGTPNDSVTHNGIKIAKLKTNHGFIYHIIKDSVLLIANTPKQLTNVYTLKNTKTSAKLLNTQNSSKSISVLQQELNSTKFKFFLDSTLNKTRLYSKLAFDTNMSQKAISLNGIAKINDSTKTLLQVVKNTIPQDNELALVTPTNSKGFLSITFSHFNSIRENLESFNKKEIDTTTRVFDNITEIGVIYKNKNALVLNSIDVEQTKRSLLDVLKKTDAYRGESIYTVENSKFFKTQLSPITNRNYNFLTVLDHFFVFSEDQNTLENIISNYQNKTTLHFKNYYNDLNTDLSSSSSLLQVYTNKGLQEFAKNNLGTTTNLSSYKASGFQFSAEDDFFYFNAAIKKSKVEVSKNRFAEAFNIKLDTEIISELQFVKNHITKANEILAQDKKFQLYLISDKGKIIWKVPLKEAIIGKVTQIDYLKNGRLQYAFATKKGLHLIDRLGRYVSNYPKQFNDIVTKPLSVFDYDKKKDYRLAITQNNKITLFNAKGDLVKGFKYKGQKTITSQPKHFRVNTKDYIVFKSDNKLTILNRVGKNRITVKQSFEFSDNPIFKKNNQFSFTTKKGSYININTNGKVTETKRNLSTKHYFTGINNNFIFLNSNTLTINKTNVELEFGNYAKPHIYKLNKKYIVAISNRDKQQTQLYNLKGEPLIDVPVFNSGTIDVNLYKNQLQLVTTGDKNSLILYTKKND